MGFFNFFKNFIRRKNKNKPKKRKKVLSRKPARNKKKLRKVSRKVRKAYKPKHKKARKCKLSVSIKRKKTKKSAIKNRLISNEKKVGIVTHYFGKISVGIIKLSSALAVGATIHIKGAHDNFTQVVSSMQYNHQDITYAEKGLEIGIRVERQVHENDVVYLVG